MYGTKLVKSCGFELLEPWGEQGDLAPASYLSLALAPVNYACILACALRGALRMWPQPLWLSLGPAGPVPRPSQP